MKTIKQFIEGQALRVVGMLVVLLICVGVYAYFKSKIPNLGGEPKEAAKVVPAQVKQTIIKTFVDSLTGQKHTQFTNNANNLSQSALNNGAISPGLLDTVSKALDIKASQINSYMKADIVSKGDKLKAQGRTIDSLKKLITYLYKSKYIDISFTEPDSVNKNGVFGYKYRNQLTTTQYSPRKFLGIPIGRDVIDIASADTAASINGLTAFSIKPQDRFFGAELQGMTQYNPNSKTFLPGIGGQLRFGRLYLTGAYYYNVAASRGFPLVGARMAILKY